MNIPEGYTLDEPLQADAGAASLPQGFTLDVPDSAVPSGFTLDAPAPAVDPLEARSLSAPPTPRQGLLIPESTHPGDLAFKEKLAADALAKAQKESALKAGGREAAFGVVPTLAGIGTGAAVGAGIGAVATGPLAPAGAVVGGIIGGVGAAMGADWLQNKAIETVAPEQAAQWQAERAAAAQVHPFATMAGSLAPQLIAMKPSFKNVATAAKAAKALLAGKALGKEGIDQLFNVGLGAGLQGVQESYAQYRAGDFNGVRLAAQIVGGAIVNEPNKFGVKLGLHPSTGELDVLPADVQPAPAGATDAQLVDMAKPAPAVNTIDPATGLPVIVKPAIDVPSTEIPNAPPAVEAVQAAPEVKPPEVVPAEAPPVAAVEGAGVGTRTVEPLSPPTAEPIPAAQATRTVEGVVSSTAKLPKPAAMSRDDVVAELRAKGVKETQAGKTALSKATVSDLRNTLAAKRESDRRAALRARPPTEAEAAYRAKLAEAQREAMTPVDENTANMRQRMRGKIQRPDRKDPLYKEILDNVPAHYFAKRGATDAKPWDAMLRQALGDKAGERYTIDDLGAILKGRLKTKGEITAEEIAASVPHPQDQVDAVKAQDPRVVNETELAKDSLVMKDGEWHKVIDHKDGRTLQDGKTIEVPHFGDVEITGALKPGDFGYPAALAEFKAQEALKLETQTPDQVLSERAAKQTASAKEKMDAEAAKPLVAKPLDTTGDLFGKDKADNPLFAADTPDVPFQTTRGKVQGATLPEQRATTRTMMEPLGGKWTEGASDGHIGTWTDGKGTTIDFRHADVASPRPGETAMGMTQRTGRGKYTVTVDAKNGDITTPPHELAEIVGMAARNGISEPYHRIVRKAIGLDLSTRDGAHAFAVKMETQAGRNKIADDLLKAAPGAQSGFRKWINGVIRLTNRLFGTKVAEFIDPDFKKLANGMRDFTALKELASIDATRVDAYQTRQPTGNADADAAGAILDRMETEAAKVLQGRKLPMLRRIRDFVGRNIATINAPVNTRRADLGRDGLQPLAEKSYIAQQAQQGASSHALDRFNDLTKEWKRIGIKEQDVPELGKYMAAQRAKELYDQFASGARTEPVKSPLTAAQSDAFVRATESGANGQKMKQAADAARKSFNDSLDVLLESGTISRQSYNNIKASSQFYFPRAFLDHIDLPTGIIEKSKFGDVQVRQSGVRQIMEGSEGDMLTDPLMLLAQNISHAETIAAKNRSLNALRDLTEATTPAQRANTDWDMKEIPFDQTARRGYEKVEFWKDGVKKALEVREDLATALKMIDPGITADVAKLARHLSGTSLVKMAATGLNPEFALGNVPRDLGLHYLAANEYSPILPVAMAQQIKQAAKLTLSKALKEKLREGFSKYGGGSERLSTSDFLPDPLQSKAYRHSKTVMQSVIGALGYVGNKSEELSRLMLVNQALQKMGKTAFNASPEDWSKAVSIGKEIINFHDAGKLVKALDTVVPFLNPSFQGGRSVARAFKTHPVETTLKAAQIVAAGALMAAWNRRNDDKAWESVSESDRSTKFIVGINAERKDKDGTTRYGYLGIPVDQGWRPFMILGQMIADKLDGREVDTALLKKSIGANYIPMDFSNLPPVASAMLTYGQNHDFWTGDKVWKGRKVEPIAEQKASTPTVAVMAGEATGLSPERLNAASKKLMPSNPLGDLVGGVASIFDNDPGRSMKEDNMVRMSQWPGVRRLFRVTSPRELHADDINAARRLRIDAKGKPAAQVLNEIDKATVKQNTYRQENDLKYDKMIAQLKAGSLTKSDLLREVQKTKDANGRADIKEIARIRRRLHDRYPALHIPAPRSRND